METRQYTRKPFPVNAVQVTLQNIEQVAEWCRGTVELVSTRMLGTSTDLPVIKIQGQGDNRGKLFTASLGCFVVEQKGSFRVYKPAQFEASFDTVPEEGLGSDTPLAWEDQPLNTNDTSKPIAWQDHTPADDAEYIAGPSSEEQLASDVNA